MARNDDITPTEQGQPISGVATLKEVAVALRIVSDGLFAGAEVHRGRSEPERALFLRLSAERIRSLRDLLVEAEDILRSLTGHTSSTSIEVAKEVRMTPNIKLDGLSVSLAGAATTVLATKPLGPTWSVVAAGALFIAAWLAGRLTPHAPGPRA